MSSLINNRFALAATVEKTAATFMSPLFFSVKDLATETTNEKVTKANIVSVRGERLKFDDEKPQEYLRFVNAADSTQFIAVTKFQKSEPTSRSSSSCPKCPTPTAISN